MYDNLSFVALLVRLDLASSLLLVTGRAATEIYTLSLHDALPISTVPRRAPPATEPAGRPRRCPGRAIANRGAKRGYGRDRKSTRLNSSHVEISYAVFCLKKKKNTPSVTTTESHSKNYYNSI